MSTFDEYLSRVGSRKDLRRVRATCQKRADSTRNAALAKDIEARRGKESTETLTRLTEDRERLAQCKQRASELEVKRQTLQQISSDTKHTSELQLYQYIANITWDKNQPENIISGVTKSINNTLQPFSFNTKEQSAFYITNQLWAAMGDEATSTNMNAENVNAKNVDAKNRDAKNDGAKNLDAKNSGAKNLDAKKSGAKNLDAKKSGAINTDYKNSGVKNINPKNDDVQLQKTTDKLKGIDLNKSERAPLRDVNSTIHDT